MEQIKFPARTISSGKIANVGRVTRERVQARARELALLAGRIAPIVSQIDYEQAKRELTGEKDLDRQEAMLDSTPSEKPCDPVPGSTATSTPESAEKKAGGDVCGVRWAPRRDVIGDARPAPNAPAVSVTGKEN